MFWKFPKLHQLLGKSYRNRVILLTPALCYCTHYFKMFPKYSTVDFMEASLSTVGVCAKCFEQKIILITFHVLYDEICYLKRKCKLFDMFWVKFVAVFLGYFFLGGGEGGIKILGGWKLRLTSFDVWYGLSTLWWRGGGWKSCQGHFNYIPWELF